jgi:hypothetical protein
MTKMSNQGAAAAAAVATANYTMDESSANDYDSPAISVMVVPYYHHRRLPLAFIRLTTTGMCVLPLIGPQGKQASRSLIACARRIASARINDDSKTIVTKNIVNNTHCVVSNNNNYKLPSSSSLSLVVRTVAARNPSTSKDPGTNYNAYITSVLRAHSCKHELKG